MSKIFTSESNFHFLTKNSCKTGKLKYGLVYAIKSHITLYQEGGIFSIKFSCDPNNSLKVLKIIKLELKKKLQKMN